MSQSPRSHLSAKSLPGDCSRLNVVAKSLRETLGNWEASANRAKLPLTLAANRWGGHVETVFRGTFGLARNGGLRCPAITGTWARGEEVEHKWPEITMAERHRLLHTNKCSACEAGASASTKPARGPELVKPRHIKVQRSHRRH